MFLDQIQVFLTRNHAMKLICPISTSSQTVFLIDKQYPVYKSTCQIMTDIIAKGEEQNINFRGRETVQNDRADQFCHLASCHQHFRFTTTTITMSNEYNTRPITLWQATYYLFEKMVRQTATKTKNYSSPRQDSSCFATVDISTRTHDTSAITHHHPCDFTWEDT